MLTTGFLQSVPKVPTFYVLGAHHLFYAFQYKYFGLKSHYEQYSVCVCVCVYLGFYRRVSIRYDYLRMGTDFLTSPSERTWLSFEPASSAESVCNFHCLAGLQAHATTPS